MAAAASGRHERPVVGVGGVVFLDGRVLLIRRGKEPLKGRWSVPGGTVEAGETLEQAVVREIDEETGLKVRPVEILMVFDRIHREQGELVYHYVIVDYLCTYVSGLPRAGSDAECVALAAREELPAYELPDKALDLVLLGFERSQTSPCAEPPAGSRILK